MALQTIKKGTIPGSQQKTVLAFRIALPLAPTLDTTPIASASSTKRGWPPLAGRHGSLAGPISRRHEEACKRQSDPQGHVCWIRRPGVAMCTAGVSQRTKVAVNVKRTSFLARLHKHTERRKYSLVRLLRLRCAQRVRFDQFGTAVWSETRNWNKFTGEVGLVFGRSRRFGPCHFILNGVFVRFVIFLNRKTQRVPACVHRSNT